MGLQLDLPENLGTEIGPAATLSYLTFRSRCPKPVPEPGHERHLLRFCVARLLVRAGYRTILIRPIVRVDHRQIRVDVAARREGSVVVALCEYPEATPETVRKIAMLERAEGVEVLVAHEARPGPSRDALTRLDKPGGPSQPLCVVSVTFPRSCDLLAEDTWIYAECLLAGAEIRVGNVGSAAARLLQAEGCRVVGLSDVRGGIYRREGLDLAAVRRHVQDTGSLAGFPGAEPVSNAALLERPCDVLVPAAIEGQITAANAARIQTRLIVEGANGPTTPGADEILAGRGILVVPDILANAGGVIVSYFEWVQDLQSYFWSEEEINAHLERLMVHSYRAVAAFARAQHLSLRTGALIFAVKRVADALVTRGIYP